MVRTSAPSAWTASMVHDLIGTTVDMDGAGAALAGVAADVGAGEVEVLAQRLDEEPSGLDVELPGCPIDDERDVFAHGRNLLRRVRRRTEAVPVSSRSPPALDHAPVRAVVGRSDDGGTGSAPESSRIVDPRPVRAMAPAASCAERGAPAADRAWIQRPGDLVGRQVGEARRRSQALHLAHRDVPRQVPPATTPWPDRPGPVRDRRSTPRSRPPTGAAPGRRTNPAAAGSAPQTIPRSPGVRRDEAPVVRACDQVDRQARVRRGEQRLDPGARRRSRRSARATGAIRRRRRAAERGRRERAPARPRRRRSRSRPARGSRSAGSRRRQGRAGRALRASARASVAADRAGRAAGGPCRGVRPVDRLLDRAIGQARGRLPGRDAAPTGIRSRRR